MNFDDAAMKVNKIDDEIDRINLEAKKKVAELTKMRVDFENWFALKAQEEGLKTIPTLHGTVYWANHSKASVAEPAVFKQFVIDNGAFDLIETRAAKLAIKSYIDAHGAPPPGVNYSTVSVFNLRRTNPTVKE